jgi:hypothetical protein
VRSSLENRWAWERTEKRLTKLVEYPPSGCRWCGVGERSHCRGWTPEVGMHGYEPPIEEQIKARMLIRRGRS